MKFQKSLIFILIILIFTSISISAGKSDCNRADINKDGNVNALDFSYIRLYLFGQENCGKGNKWCSRGDQNKDGLVDGKDLDFVLSLFEECSLTTKIVINEFDVAPQIDWDNSGTIGTGDEWVELYNNGTTSIDLTNWKLEMQDTTSETHALSGVIYPGAQLVVLNPTGTQNND